MIPLIDTMRKGKAVYWPPTADAFGRIVPDDFSKATFGPPQELAVFWMDTGEVYQDARGTTRTSRAIVYTGIDIPLWGMMMNGPLTAIPAGRVNDPKNIQGAFLVRQFAKIPTIDYDQFVRKAYL